MAKRALADYAVSELTDLIREHMPNGVTITEFWNGPTNENFAGWKFHRKHEGRLGWLKDLMTDPILHLSGNMTPLTVFDGSEPQLIEEIIGELTAVIDAYFDIHLNVFGTS